MKKLNLKGLKAKKWVIVLSASVLVVALIVGIVFGISRSGGEAVPVYNFNDIGMTEYWGDTQESYGPVSTDRIQTVFLSDTQTVTEVAVSEGDTVKKGDLLLRFDTTLNDLKLERKRLETEKARLELEDSKQRLNEIKNMRPMQVPATPDDTPSEDLGTGLSGSFQIFPRSDHDGSTMESAIVCWLADNYSMGSNFYDAVLEAAREQQEANRPVPEPTEPGETTAPAESTSPTETTAPTDANQTPEGGDTAGAGEGSSPSAVEGEPEQEPLVVNNCYFIVKITSGNMSKGRIQTWQGVYLSRSGGSYYLRFVSASGNTDYTLAQETEVDMPDIDFGSGYTAAQIAQMRREQEKTIKDNEFKLKVAEAEYKIMEREMSDGNVYADIDGKVVSCLEPADAKAQNQPVLKVSGGGGFTVTGAVSELLKDQLQIGQTVTVNDWNTGMTYEGSITSVGDFPTTNNYYSGMGNTNVSYYPFTVFVDESADLREGGYVNMRFSTAGTENGVYLGNPFVRTENGRSYVMVEGQDGKLEKRFVTTGKALWGSYTEIRSGITEDDRLAFPYGKNVKVGAKTTDGNLADLYR